MPPRSVLLNLSITAKSIEKERVVESVSEVEFGKNGEIKLEAEGNRERVDSATSVLPSPSFNNILNTTDNAMAINNILTTAATSTYGMTTMPQACGTCEGLARFDGTKLRHCTGCRQILYCSVNCQKQDWPRHKSDCRRARGITPINSAASSPPAQSPTSLPPSEVASPIDVTSLEPMILDSHTIPISGDMDMNMDSDQCAMLTAPSSTAFSSLPHTHLKSANIASIPAA